MLPLGSIESNSWLITSSCSFSIDRERALILFYFAFYQNMGQTFCTGSPALMHRHACVYTMYSCVCSQHSVQQGAMQRRREHAVPSFTATQPQHAARFTATCVCLVLPEGCGGDVMNHLNEGQGVWCGSTAVTHTLQAQTHPQIDHRMFETIPLDSCLFCQFLIKSPKLSHVAALSSNTEQSYLFK